MMRRAVIRQRLSPQMKNRKQSSIECCAYLQTPRHYSIVPRFPHSKICVHVPKKSIFTFVNARKHAKTAGILQVCASRLHQNAAAGCEPAALD
jgi:hypothetical protein